jgi:26S proteasome regulatory subunit N9
MASSTTSQQPQAPPKLVLDEFISLALNNTPTELHPFFDSFKTLYTKK